MLREKIEGDRQIAHVYIIVALDGRLFKIEQLIMPLLLYLFDP